MSECEFPVRRVPAMTERQRECARKLHAQGLSLREIARRLGYSYSHVQQAVTGGASLTGPLSGAEVHHAE